MATRYGVGKFPTTLVFGGGCVVRRLVGHPLAGELELVLETEIPRAASLLHAEGCNIERNNPPLGAPQEEGSLEGTGGAGLSDRRRPL